ncbi:MAG: efflux RND transporter periplasmic adaptor subunit [Chloroflexi bacterium]|nr:efflux RND transporter periplasmic adaptor subunit [Chloroflexota bacterium]
MKHKIIRLIVILLILGAVGGGYWYFSQHPDQLSQLQSRLGLTSQANDGDDSIASGFIEAEDINVAAELQGRITHIAAKEGDFVEAEQVLVELDTALLDAEVQQTQAKIATAKAQLAKIEAGVRAEEIAKAEAAVAQAEANAEAAGTLWQDAITLRDNPQELDIQINAAQTNLKLAELRVEHAIPFKDAAVAMNGLQEQQVRIIEEGRNVHLELPRDASGFSLPSNVELNEDLEGAAPGDDIRAHVEFPEGTKRQAWTNWNLATTDEWQRWVDLNSAQADRADAETTLNDLLTLRNDPQAAQIKVAQAEAAYQTALAEVGVAKAQLDILKAGARSEQIAIAQAQVKQAEASLAALQVQRDQHTLVAPLDAWVVEQPAHEGEMATPGATLLTLADLNDLTLTVYVVEPNIGQVAIGQSVQVYVDAFPGKPFTGHVTFISDKAEFTPRNIQTKEERANIVFAVKIKLDNPDQQLKPGMPADAVLAEGPQL